MTGARGQARPAPHVNLPSTVLDAALARIRWLFDEFTNVSVSVSGGKDSTVTTELALTVARERGRLPLRVWWLDQECEFEHTVAYQRRLFDRPDISPGWYQVPFLLSNATTHGHDYWHHVWGEDEAHLWVRPKEPDAIHSNTFGAEHFHDLLSAIGDHESPGGVVLTGMRAEESPHRRMSLRGQPVHKWATWGSKTGRRNHITMGPIFDWTYRDIWKAIHEHGWDHNRLYDWMHRYGIPAQQMRVSNYHHETAVHSLFWLQEVEPETWERAVARASGINTAGHLGADDFFVTELPFMFASWVEYRDYLLDKLITDPDHHRGFVRKFAQMDRLLSHVDPEFMARHQVQAILVNDTYHVKLENFRANHGRRPGRGAARGREGAPSPPTT